MANEHSGILDANSLFGDLPHFMASPPSSVPPSGLEAYGPASVVICEAPVPRYSRRDETTARSRRRADPTQARLIAVITCGSIALAAALAACMLYASTPSTPSTPTAPTAPTTVTAAR